VKTLVFSRLCFVLVVPTCTRFVRKKNFEQRHSLLALEITRVFAWLQTEQKAT
jgi:hypothetical protein